MRPSDETQTKGGERRILVVDDNVAIHDVFVRSSASSRATTSSTTWKQPFSAARMPQQAATPRVRFQVDAVSQGRDGYESVVRARRMGPPLRH